MLKKFKNFLFSDITIAIFIFLVAAGIRTIPEIKAGIWPIGYDTFNTYAAELETYSGPLINWLRTANLIYFIFWPFVKIGIDAGLLMKIFGPIFFGGLAVSFYFWTRHFIKFNALKSFLASILIIFQLAALRISWDLYRNELALIFFFWALINFTKIEKKKNLILMSVFTALVGFSNELVTVMLLVVLFFYILTLLFRKKYQLSWRVIAPLVILAAIFWLATHSPGKSLYSSHIIFISNNDYRVWRYFYQYDKELPYRTLFDLISRLFLLLYLYLLPLALYGFWLLRKNLILTAFTAWLLIGTFSALIFAGVGLIVWERWLIMLAFPLAIYAVEGAFKIGQLIVTRLKKWHELLGPAIWTTAILFWLGFIGLFVWQAFPFLTKSYPDIKPPLKDDTLNNYFPPTMVHNSVGIWKIEDTFSCIEWLDQHVPSGAVVLVDNRYRGLMLTHFTMDDRYIITNNWSNDWPKSSFEFAKTKGFKNIYLIWRNQRVSPPGFDKVYASSDIAIYKAVSLDE